MTQSSFGGYLRQSTAVTIELGPFVDETDGWTAETGLTLTQPDIRLSKNGAAFAQKNAAQTLSHMENGYYSLSLDATDTNTVGRLRVHVKEGGARPLAHTFMVLEEEIYDGMFASTAGASTWLPVNVEAWLGTGVAATTAGTPNINVVEINGVSGAASVLRRWLQAYGVNILTVDSGTTTTITDAALTLGTGAYLGGIVHVYGGTNAGMSFRVVAFNAGTDTLTVYPTAPAAFDNTSLYVIVPDAIGADVWGFGGTAATTSSGRPEVNVSHYGGSAGTFSGGRPEVNTTHAAGTAWNSGAITANTLASGAITAAKFAANALDAVWSTATRLLTAGTNIVLAKGTGVTGFNDLDAAGVRSAVGLASANLDTQIGDLPTNAELATALGTADDAVLAQVALVKAKTDLIPATPADESTVAAVKAKTDSLTFTLANKVDSNIEAVNGANITGSGVPGDTWGPA